VKFANSYGIPFLAVSKAHGSTKTLGRCQNGIEIRLAQLNEIIISPDGTSAFMQGGVYVDQVVQTLWDAGYVTGKVATAGDLHHADLRQLPGAAVVLGL
jgi:FAD/FMN-containing dehydrogenase